ncbi:MAG: hypothetical protein HYS13_19075 [Planctomycetia bacterium]|nr:hypothetical protein [Planctomycetia bacterium]
MSIFSKVLLVLQWLTTIALFIIATYALAVWNGYRSVYEDARKKVEKLKIDEEVATNGDKLKKIPNIVEARELLARAVAHRGRAWYQCRKGNVDANGTMSVVVGVPRPSEIDDKDVLYVFEATPAEQAALDAPLDAAEIAKGVGNPPAAYLGEFRVTLVDAQNHSVSLEPTAPLSAAEIARLNATNASLVLHEKMPQDSHEAMAGLTQAQLDVLVPMPAEGAAGLVDEKSVKGLTAESHSRYLRHGGAPEADDPDDRVIVTVTILKDAAQLDNDDAQLIENELRLDRQMLVKDAEVRLPKAAAEALVGRQIAAEKKREYVRPLRDYLLLFRELNREIPELKNAVAALAFDLETAAKALAQSEKYEMARIQEKERLTAERDRMAKERQVVTEYAAELDQKVKDFAADNQRLLDENRKLAAQLAKAQAEALKRHRAATSKAGDAAPEKQ